MTLYFEPTVQLSVLGPRQLENRKQKVDPECGNQVNRARCCGSVDFLQCLCQLENRKQKADPECGNQVTYRAWCCGSVDFLQCLCTLSHKQIEPYMGSFADSYHHSLQRWHGHAICCNTNRSLEISASHRLSKVPDLQEGYPNSDLTNQHGFSTKGQPFLARRSTMPQNLRNYNGSPQVKNGSPVCLSYSL